VGGGWERTDAGRCPNPVAITGDRERLSLRSCSVHCQTFFFRRDLLPNRASFQLAPFFFYPRCASLLCCKVLHRSIYSARMDVRTLTCRAQCDAESREIKNPTYVLAVLQNRRPSTDGRRKWEPPNASEIAMLCSNKSGANVPAKNNHIYYRRLCFRGSRPVSAWKATTGGAGLK
jgi:hypothetical protein